MEDKLKKMILDEIYLESSKECTLRSASNGLNFDFASLYSNMKMFSMDGYIKKSNRIKKIKNIFNVLH